MNRMVEVYNDDVKAAEKLYVKVTAGTAKIMPGKPHLVAKVNAMPRGTVRVDEKGRSTVIYGTNCELEITYPKAASLDIGIGSGTVSVSGMSPKRSFALNVSSGTAMIELEGLAKQGVAAAVKSGTLSGTLGYLSKGVDSDVLLSVNAGTVNVQLELPKGIAIRNKVSRFGVGRMVLPEQRSGKNGEVRIDARVGAGTFIVKD